MFLKVERVLLPSKPVQLMLSPLVGGSFLEEDLFRFNSRAICVINFNLVPPTEVRG
jgi:hypothetical protein